MRAKRKELWRGLHKNVVDGWWGERDEVSLWSLFVLSLGWDSAVESKWEENSAFLEKVSFPAALVLGGIHNLKGSR